MTSGEYKTIAIYPPGIVGINAEGVSEENSADLGGSQREAKVTGTACVNGIDG